MGRLDELYEEIISETIITETIETETIESNNVINESTAPYIEEQGSGINQPEWATSISDTKNSVPPDIENANDSLNTVDGDDFGLQIKNDIKNAGEYAKSALNRIWSSISPSSSFTDNYNSVNINKEHDGSIGGKIGMGLGVISAGVYAGLKVGKDTMVNTASFLFNNGFDMADSAISSLSETVSSYYKYIPTNTALGAALKSIYNTIVQGMQNYQDGISETAFGAYMKKSWQGNDSSFLNFIASKKGVYKFKIMKSTPLDSGSTQSSLYGSLMLGCPYLFNKNADPRNRAIINSFIKDGKFLSLTPGLPKYNGSSYLQNSSNNIYQQTENPGEMINYLLKNGLDSSFTNKDKRYYTFEAKYEEYYSYLEAMLNPIWIKLGLANSSDNTFNIFSFFDLATGDDTIDPSKYSILKDRYRSSLGFFCNASGAVTENVSNSTTSFGSSLSSDVNSQSDEFQKINYMTGMGTGTSSKNISRRIGIGLQTASALGRKLSDSFTTAQKYAKSANGKIGAIAKGIIGAGIDVMRIGATEDLGSWIQSFSTSNGMKVVYPELWGDSSYRKSLSVSLSFTSPYGDPYSIFKYVYVPFCALLCFGLPRQAAENGFVSPFFVRADIPGLATSDLAIVSDISWTKGGSNNLWTKDGLPRSIDVQLTIEDLYPYLAMTKRFSFLSANPSFTVFLDNMAGMCSVYTDNGDDPLKQYWHRLINRVSGQQNFDNNLWNKFNSDKRTSTIWAAERISENITRNTDYRQIPWLHNNQ